jgi:hypothetical protein
VNSTLLALLLVFVGTPSSGAEQPSAAATDEIRTLQTEFVGVLREKDTAKFLTYIGARGVAFGVDGAFQKRTDVAAEFHDKRGAYCILFDSTCLTVESRSRGRAMTGSPRLCSVSDLLTHDWQVKSKLGSYEGKPQTHLSITAPASSCSNGREPVEFIFTRFADGWKLVAVPYT